MFRLLKDPEGRLSGLELADNLAFSRPLNGERVKMGEVCELYSVVGYPTQIKVKFWTI